MMGCAQAPPRLPQVLLTPDPLSAPPALGKKKRNFLACWDLPSSPLCKDKFKVVGGQQVLSSAQGTRAQRWAGPAEVTDQPEAELPPISWQPPTTGTKARLDPAPDPWVILGQSGLSAGLSVPGVIDTRMGRAQPLTHPRPGTCQQEVPPWDRHAGGCQGLSSSPRDSSAAGRRLSRGRGRPRCFIRALSAPPWPQIMVPPGARTQGPCPQVSPDTAGSIVPAAF